MNVKRNPSFNILGFGTLYCGAKIINNYSKPPVCPHNMFRGANSRAAFSLLPVFPAAGGSALSLSPGRREAACSGYGTFFGLLFLRPCPLAFAPCPGSGDAPLQGFESGCGRGRAAPHAPAHSRIRSPAKEHRRSPGMERMPAGKAAGKGARKKFRNRSRRPHVVPATATGRCRRQQGKPAAGKRPPANLRPGTYYADIPEVWNSY